MTIDYLRQVLKRTYLKFFWRFRGMDSVKTGLANRHYPRRRYLADKVLIEKPSCLVEFGSGYGPNLFEIANRNNTINCFGIDINPNSIKLGKAEAEKQNISNIHFIRGGVKEFAILCNNADVVITDTTLMYLNDRELDSFIQKILCLNPVLCIHIEFHRDSITTIAIDDGWLRDYANAYRRNGASVEQIKVEKLPAEFCGAENWQKYAHLIEVRLRK